MYGTSTFDPCCGAFGEVRSKYPKEDHRREADTYGRHDLDDALRVDVDPLTLERHRGGDVETGVEEPGEKRYVEAREQPRRDPRTVRRRRVRNRGRTDL